MKTWHKVLIGLGIVVILLGIFAGVGIGAYNKLVGLEQQYHAGGSHYGAALDLCSQKIEGVWLIMDQYLDHETNIYNTAMEARSAFYQAAAEGDPDTTVQAAMDFQLVAVHEAYPQLVSVPVAQQAMTALQEGVNEIKTALDDWIYATQTYNSARKSFPTVIIGNLAGFPKEYQYYQAEQAKLNITEILK